jgi:hypothetical protein
MQVAHFWFEINWECSIYLLMTEKEIALILTYEKQLEFLSLMTENVVIADRLVHMIQGHYLI